MKCIAKYLLRLYSLLFVKVTKDLAIARQDIELKKKQGIKIVKLNNTDVQGDYIISTKNGLYLIKNRTVFRILRGDFYGITYINKDILVYENRKGFGRLLKLNLESSYSNIVGCKVVMGDLPSGCHQIDYIAGKLYVLDTYNNAVLGIDSDYRVEKKYYPMGELQNGRKSENYAHLNSIYRGNNNSIYFLAHNETVKTGKNSEVIKTDMQFNITEIIKTKSVNGHNIIVHNDDYYYCDSLNYKLLKNDTVVFTANYLLRGLSLSDNLILVGGSEISPRHLRPFATGAIFQLDTECNLVCSEKLSGSVTEIRRLDKIDYSLSDYGKLEE